MDWFCWLKHVPLWLYGTYAIKISYFVAFFIYITDDKMIPLITMLFVEQALALPCFLHVNLICSLTSFHAVNRDKITLNTLYL